MADKDIRYSQLVDMASPAAVFEEVRILAGLMPGAIDTVRLETVFAGTCALYLGQYPGYRKCNTLFHDLRHTTDVLLSFTRLLHGAYLDGVKFPPAEATIALVSTLMHDTGYIQKSDDRKGTGGKYTLTHVERSITFLEEFLPAHGFDSTEVGLCGSLVHGTSIAVAVSRIRFPTPSAAMLGKMVATTDLLGQLADRIYLEKLLFLYREFKEANFGDYRSELELLTSTIGFYALMEERLANDLANVRTHMRSHFMSRWDVDRDLYQEAIGHNLDYLRGLLAQHRQDYRNNLRRDGLVEKLVAMETADNHRKNGK